MNRKLKMGFAFILMLLLLSCSVTAALADNAGDNIIISYDGGGDLWIKAKKNNVRMKDFTETEERSWIDDPYHDRAFKLNIKRNGKAITHIGNYAFYKLDSLFQVDIPKNFNGDVGNYSFADCGILYRVNLGNGVTTIGNHAFDNCSKLKYFFTDKNAKNYSSKKDIVITAVGDYAFANCKRLELSNTWSSLKTIGEGAFQSCESFQYIHRLLTDSLQSIGNYAFKACINLEKVNAPANVKSIGDYAFIRCDKLWSVVLKTKDIGKGAFMALPALTTLTLDEGVENIGAYAFSNTPITSIVFPESLKTIGASAFQDCYKATGSIVLPTNINRVEANTFNGCSGITIATLPAGLSYIGTNAFANTGITDVYYFGTRESREDIDFTTGNEALLNATWHYWSERENYQIEAGAPEATVGEVRVIEVSRGGAGEVNSNTLPERMKVAAKYFNWTVSSTAKAELKPGKITFLKAGDVTITISLKRDPTKKATFTFHVGEVELKKLYIKNTKTVIDLNESNKLVLTPVYRPENTTQTKLTWTSSNDEIATVNSNGFVVFQKAGTVTITCTSKVNPDIKASIKLTASTKKLVTSIKLKANQTTVNLSDGKATVKLTAAVSPDNAKNKELVWSSSDTSIATVKNGKVSFKKPGTVTITATAADGGGARGRIKLTAVQPVTVIKLKADQTEVILSDGKAIINVTAKLKPDDATNKTVTWASSDEKIATVENGKVTFKKAGTVAITCTANDGSKVKCTIKLTARESR